MLNALRSLIRPLRTSLRRFKQNRYYRDLIRAHRSPFSRPTESFEGFEERERDASMQRARARYEEDMRFIEALPDGMERNAAVRAIIDRVLRTPPIPPRFYDYDYIDDVVHIIEGRYCGDEGSVVQGRSSTIDALCQIVGVGDRLALPAGIRSLLGGKHGYIPMRGDVTQHVREVIPDLATEFVELKAEENPARFLEINREYSRRQAVTQGLFDNRKVSLLRGYERDHQQQLRAIIELIHDGRITKDEEALLIGPRYIDEIRFFRKILGLRRTIGLDLFAYGKDEIIGGDMHAMPFSDRRFKIVFCAGTLSYSYNVRRMIDEMARVLTRPGYIFLIDAAGRTRGPDALGRSDVMNVETLVGMFYQYPFKVIAKDAGRSLAPENYCNEPCLALLLEDRP